MKIKTHLLLLIFIIKSIISHVYSESSSGLSSSSSSSFEISSSNNGIINDDLFEIPTNINDNSFICFGESTDASLYIENNTYYYTPHPTINEDSLTYLPKGCSKTLNSNHDEKSCCLKQEEETYNKVLDYLSSNNTMGIVYECNGKKPRGNFKIVEDDGSTPDVSVDVNDIYVVDTRESVKICMEQLSALQCFRCSQDHRTILRDFPTKYELDKIQVKQDKNSIDHEPLFFIPSSRYSKNEIDPITGNVISKTYTNGKSISLCNNYFSTLMSHCQYVNLRGVQINKLYKPTEKNPVFTIYDSKINQAKLIEIPKLDQFSYVSTDNQDLFYVSNFNCLKLDIPEFIEPTCTYLVDGNWSNHTTSSQESDTSTASNNSIVILTFINIIIIVVITCLI